MRKTLLLLFILATLLFCLSCDLKRSNPLDPESNNGIVAPPKVTGLEAVGSGFGEDPKFVTLTWTRNSTYTTGYYIYRGLAYNSQYSKVGEITNPTSGNTVTAIVSNMTPGYFYFKVSAYHDYPAGRLEGPWSEWALAFVDN